MIVVVKKRVIIEGLKWPWEVYTFVPRKLLPLFSSNTKQIVYGLVFLSISSFKGAESSFTKSRKEM